MTTSTMTRDWQQWADNIPMRRHLADQRLAAAVAAGDRVIEGHWGRAAATHDVEDVERSEALARCLRENGVIS